MKHVCSPCGLEFATEKEYLEHQCSKAQNAKPTSADFLVNTTTPNFAEVQTKALERGKNN